ncbi:Glycosyl transferase, family 2 [Trichormus variabilis ATCC 29413]|uniref:Glycosyl transferase, family 2 n=4 Tax=Anabaena variabilis TaxID=264691 RepID=Q3M7S8_TRIV2|nr:MULTISPECIES: glycosyltransferase [Nostocaceae]ABA22958.1 Glycosyl transferase, family 2 [Trichormus variabilis ATCC 29413]MBC1213826.1 glycosyltransferase [Trichormus variabilis ARAD]MBC1266451.1 glycosyltransferase [Trichormus variabilis FSR]MBC1302593.1 glycosyltransferase [Trichormus variabilis N2B]MBC1325552.1 glycosyltransferase [Trichormus variabilis 9RC]
MKIFKFLLGGSLAAALNLLLIFLLVEKLNFNTPLLRNIANVISIEISLIFSFFVYRTWVWTGGVWNLREVFLRQLPLYHVSAGLAVFTRVFLIFPILDWLQVNYAVNTVIGALLSASINYFISDSFVFKTPRKQNRDDLQGEIPLDTYYPEALAPAISIGSKSKQSESKVVDVSKTITTLSIVIPAYNEEDCIVQTIQTISKTLEIEQIDYEILVVNDNSRDRTEELLQQITSHNSKLRYVNNYYPNGFGFAVRCGLENFTGDAVAVVMADSSDAPEDIVSYFHKLQEGYDCVFGSRFIKGGKVIDYPGHKLVVNRLANLFIQILFSLKFNDITNAFKVYRKEVIEGISPLISHHFNLTVELPLKAIVRGYSFTTIPIIWRNRTTGVSKLKLKEMGSRYLFIVLYIWLEKHLSRGDYHLSKKRTVVKSKAESNG